ncbi:MAG: FeoB-associated Cys-rich membrane protein [Campylobacter sputorum]|nr:FeoB-associated Cys-rich membrane protein [Campylobacter sputorum]MDY6120555.1 FeoB-associated Cys-rich membrane protein [Campylobacter sputorum]
MGIYEIIFLVIVVGAIIWHFYKTIFVNKGCGCGCDKKQNKNK